MSWRIRLGTVAAAAVFLPRRAPRLASLRIFRMASSSGNPLLRSWDLPPFAEITPDLFAPAFELAQMEHSAELNAIATKPSAPTFANTVEAIDGAGALLTRVSDVFHNLCSSFSSPELQAVEASLAAPLSAHALSAYHTPGLFDRLDAVFAARLQLNLDPAQLQLVDRLHADFVRAGARLDAAAKARCVELGEQLATRMTRFTQNVTLDESEVILDLAEGDLTGCPEDVVEAARAVAARRATGAPLATTLSRSQVEPILMFATRRDVRERVFRAWSRRGELVPERDNKTLAVEVLRLRAELARLHGHASFGAYQLEDTMAKTPTAVMSLLRRVWTPAKAAAADERALLEACAAREAASTGAAAPPAIEPWDWRYFAEKVRKEEYDFDEADVKPFLSLDAMTVAIFDVARRLFGLRFVPRPDIPVYHPDVKAYEVREIDSECRDVLVAFFLHDLFARPYKQSGAWMSTYRDTYRGSDGARVVPIVVNNCNFTKGSPTLLSYDDAITLFHEFGHGLHGMLSTVESHRLAGTSVLRDFVELPSQLFEHWLSRPEVLKAHALHHETGEPIPDSLVAKLEAARIFNNGFGTVEYTSCALVDQALHALDSDALSRLDLDEFEKVQLLELGMPQGVALRHRLPHFQHLFSSGSYAAAYYVYLWAEVLDADAFDAFVEAGDPFDAATAARLRSCIYAAGGTSEPGAAYRAFRGRDPSIRPMLKKKLGLTGADAD